MSDSITITIPEIKQETINALSEASAQEHKTVVVALAAIREKYAPLARHNGYVKIAYLARCYSSNRPDSCHETDGEKTRALLAVDGFGKNYYDQNSGGYEGSRLYLTSSGTWLKITRTGHWSRWHGEPEGWNCGVSICDGNEDDRGSGGIWVMTDEEVEHEYKLEDVVEGLSKSLKTLSEEFPERLTRIRERTSLAAQLLAALRYNRG